MIKVYRTTSPKILQNKKAAWMQSLREARKNKDAKKFFLAQSKYGHHSVKTSLVDLFNGKCAYCESIIGVVTTSHIEHFRPKSKYLSLTFSWENLLLGCPKCNDKAHKGNKFPKVSSGGPLVDPTIDDPLDHFQFSYDSATGTAIVWPITPRGVTTENIFKLNSRKELIKSRTELIKKLIFIKKFEASHPEAAALLARARDPDSPYLAWVRALNL